MYYTFIIFYYILIRIFNLKKKKKKIRCTIFFHYLSLGKNIEK